MEKQKIEYEPGQRIGVGRGFFVISQVLGDEIIVEGKHRIDNSDTVKIALPRTWVNQLARVERIERKLDAMRKQKEYYQDKAEKSEEAANAARNAYQQVTVDRIELLERSQYLEDRKKDLESQLWDSETKRSKLYHEKLKIESDRAKYKDQSIANLVAALMGWLLFFLCLAGSYFHKVGIFS